MSNVLGLMFKKYKNKRILSSRNGYIKVCIVSDGVSYLIHGMTDGILKSVDPADVNEAFSKYVDSKPDKKSIAFTRLLVNYALRKHLSNRFPEQVVEKLSHFYECNFKRIYNWSDYIEAFALYGSVEVSWKPRNGRINTYIHDDISTPLERITSIGIFNMWGIMDHMTVTKNFKTVLQSRDTVIVNLLQVNELAKYFFKRDNEGDDITFEAIT